MAVRLDLATDQLNLAILESGEGLGQRGISGAQTLYFTAFKCDSGFHSLKQLVFKRRPLVRDSSPSIGWTLLCHGGVMLSDALNAATAFPSVTYNQVAV